MEAASFDLPGAVLATAITEVEAAEAVALMKRDGGQVCTCPGVLRVAAKRTDVA
jgi:hypothetical protein